jgi:hypothetical protein
MRLANWPSKLRLPRHGCCAHWLQPMRTEDNTMKRTIITAVFFFGTVLAAQADTWVFKDVSRPHGSERDMAAKQADARTCGSSDGQSFVTAHASRFKKCMRAHGWALDQIVRDTRRSPSQQPSADWKKYHPSVDWTDFLGPCGAPIC